MKEFNKSIWLGILVGIVVPIVGYAITLMVFEQLASIGAIQSFQGTFSNTQTRTIWVLGIIFNLIPFQYFKIKRIEKAMNGIVMMTIIAVIIWIIYYNKSLF